MKVWVEIDGSAALAADGEVAAAAWVLRREDGSILREGVKSFRGTSNQAECRAAILGIGEARAIGATAATVVTDSELLVRVMRGQAQAQALEPLIHELQQASIGLSVSYVWGGRKAVRRAHLLASQAVREARRPERVPWVIEDDDEV